MAWEFNIEISLTTFESIWFGQRDTTNLSEEPDARKRKGNTNLVMHQQLAPWTWPSQIMPRPIWLAFDFVVVSIVELKFTNKRGFSWSKINRLLQRPRKKQHYSNYWNWKPYENTWPINKVIPLSFQTNHERTASNSISFLAQGKRQRRRAHTSLKEKKVDSLASWHILKMKRYHDWWCLRFAAAGRLLWKASYRKILTHL